MRVSYLAGTVLPALILILLSSSLAAPPDHSNSGGNDRLDEILGRLDAIDSELREIKKEVVHCTVRARSRGECDRVIESQISACFELNIIEAEFPIKWRTEVEGKAEGGVAWTSGPDGKIILNIKMPAGPVPTDFGLDLSTGAGVKTEVCMDIPIELIGGGTFAMQSVQTHATSDDPIEQLQMKLEQLSAVVMPAVVDRINSRLPSGERIQAGFAALDTIANGEFDLQGGIFADQSGNGPLVNAIGAFPAPPMLQTAIANPAVFSQYLPMPQTGMSVAERVAMLCDPDSGMHIARSPLFAAQVNDMCMFLEGAPQFDVLADLTADDIVDGIKEIMQPLLTDAGETAEQTRNRFCSSSAGQRRIFDRLCGR